MTTANQHQRPTLVVGVGASAGGLEACKQLLAKLPSETGLAFVVVLHLDPQRISHLAEVLESSSALPVVQVNEPRRLEPDRVYVIAPNTSLEFLDGELRPGVPVARAGIGGGVIDMLSSSLAQAYGGDAVAMVLSGIGSDGSAAVADVKAAGGLCIAQDPETAEHRAMPDSAIATGQVDAVLAPESMSAYLLEYASSPRPRVEPRSRGRGLEDRPTADFEGVMRLLAIHQGFDARDYKKGTLERRAERRLGLLGLEGWPEYHQYIQEHPEELGVLYQDVLIGVTQFFRDPEQWDYLEREIIPQLLDQHSETHEPIRVWSVGCATGEEPFSLAMMFLEQIDRRGGNVTLQMFATDVSEKAIAFARRASYPASIAEHVSPGRLAQFFIKQGDVYQLESRVRDVVTLARHDVLAEPPFSHIDLVSCRNLFIYFEPHAQQACLDRFYFALRPSGLLWLGSAENVDRHSQLFTTFSTKYRIFRKSEAHRRAVAPWSVRASVPSSTIVPTTNRAGRGAVNKGSRIARSLELYMLEHHVTASVVVSAAGNVLHMFGPTADYLTPPTGEVRLDLLSWVREASLYAKLRPALKRALERRETVEVGGIQLRRGAELVRVRVTIEPIPSIEEDLFLVTFGDEPEPPASEPEPQPAIAAADEALVRRLTAQLQDAQVELQGTLEELDSANEEYRASYEELLSLNEELQSSNEELETTKEEAQSVNEELMTVNRELEQRNEKLHVVNADLENLLALTTVATVFLDRQLRVRRYTPATERVLWLVPSDMGRPLEQIKRRVDDETMLVDAAQVLKELVPVEVEVRADDGRWYLRKIVPFRAGDRIDGVCVVFYDITAQKLATQQSEEARYLAESIVRSVTQPFVVFDHEFNAVSANEAFYRTFGTRKEQVDGVSLKQLCGGVWDIPRVHELLGRILHGEVGAEELELEIEQAVERNGQRNLRLTASSLERPDRTPLILISVEDVTPLREAQDAAERGAQEHRRKDEFLAMLGHELRNPLATLASGLALLRQVGSDPVRVEDIRAMLVRQTERMTVMLDQLLDVSRVSSGKIVLDVEIVDLLDVGSAAIEGARPIIAAHEHELVRALPERGAVLVQGDLVRLVQVVENLLTNAAKYTEDRGTIWLTIDADDNLARVRVRDNGLGIEPELLPRIFDLFAQGSQRLDRAQGGLGLGLALVRQLVEMHGGKVEASSAGPGHGSEFVVLLPRAEDAAVGREHPAPQVRLEDLSPLRVLVVDDEQDAAYSLAELLRSHGHQVQTAFDGPTAIESTNSFEPEVVLLDLGLPGIDGYEVAIALRQQLRRPARIIAVTGYRRDDERLRGAGFDGHLLKPPTPDQLAEQLAKVATQ